jgi:WD40 repeat protein
MWKNMEGRKEKAGPAEGEVQSTSPEPDISSLAFSPEGRVLAGGASDNSIRLWGIGSREFSEKLEKHSGAVRALAFSADGKWLLSGGDDRRVVIWSITKTWQLKDDFDKKEFLKIDYKAIQCYIGAKAIKSVAISRQGDTWAAGLEDGTIIRGEHTTMRCSTLPDPSGGSQHEANSEAKGPVLALRFSDDASVLASMSRSPGVQLWDPSGHRMGFIQVHGAATMMHLSQDGRTLVGGESGGELNVWRLARLHFLPILL